MKNKTSKVSITFILIIGVIANAYASPMYYYKDGDGDIYRICKDGDGYIVYKPSGSQDAYGRGYTWSDVKEKYGISKWFQKSNRTYDECPD